MRRWCGEPGGSTSRLKKKPHWSGLSAILISLFGWFLALRGVFLLVAPQLYQRATSAAATSTNLMLLSHVFFGLISVIGLWLTYFGWVAKPPAAP